MPTSCSLPAVMAAGQLIDQGTKQTEPCHVRADRRIGTGQGRV
jgi:hypothetical protein